MSYKEKAREFLLNDYGVDILSIQPIIPAFIPNGLLSIQPIIPNGLLFRLMQYHKSYSSVFNDVAALAGKCVLKCLFECIIGYERKRFEELIPYDKFRYEVEMIEREVKTLQRKKNSQGVIDYLNKMWSISEMVCLNGKIRFSLKN